MSDQQLITELKQQMADAIHRKDVAASVELFDDQPVMFTLAPPLRFKAGENSPGANGVAEWFESFEGEIGLTHQELEITVGNNVAFCHSLDHLTGQRTDGTATDVWYRETLGLCKKGGTWKIAHQHQSVPTYMDGSAKAAIDLKP